MKRQSKAAPISILYSLSNVANSYNAVGRFDDAHKLVDEAFGILNSEKIYMLDGFALMYNTRGKIYAKEGKWKESVDAFGRTVDLTRQVVRRSYIYMKRLVNLAEVLEKSKKFKTCLEYTKEALDIKEVTIKTLPHNTIVIECLQCMAKVYDYYGYSKEMKDTLFALEQECKRLEDMCSDQYNSSKTAVIEKTMQEVKEKMATLVVRS